MRVLVGFTINLIGNALFAQKASHGLRGLRFWQTTLSFLNCSSQITSAYPSILPNTDSLKGDAFDLCESTVTTKLRSRWKPTPLFDVADR
jgi:hypothetical protein